MVQRRGRSAGQEDEAATALWAEVRRRSETAGAAGALVALVTERCVVLDRDVPFLVHLLKGGRWHLPTANPEPDGARRNPFLPYDERLFVADLSSTHVALLNKFKVFDHHLLVVTRRFVEQEGLLEEADFHALSICLAGIDGLGFYNSGPVAGASQRHRHLQVVPRPPDDPDLFPLTGRLVRHLRAGDDGTSRLLPFHHATARPESGRLWRDGAEMAATYRRLLGEVDLLVAEDHLVPEPYNLLVTRESMLIVPRERERWKGISVNALGFAGSLLAPNVSALEAIRRVGPYHVLDRVVR